MRQVYLDANVILRLLTGDPPEMARQAIDLFTAADRDEIELFLDEIVLAETVWVLTSFYKHTAADIARTLGQLLAHEAVSADNKSDLIEALSLYADHRVDFVDALVSVHMRRRGVKEIASFDTHFDRLPGIIRITPGSPEG